MDFKEFIHRLASVISAGGSTSEFTRTVFSSILTEEGQDILDEYTKSSFKSFFNGQAGISRIAKKINAYIEPMLFADYINQFSDGALDNLCTQFSDVLPKINPHNAGELLADYFVSIITKAASSTKKSVQTDTVQDNYSAAIIMDHKAVAPEIGKYTDGVFYLDSIYDDDNKDEYTNPFKNYLDMATAYYSTKKTLLYAEKPHPFYDMYVCNDIHHRKTKAAGLQENRKEKTIHDASIKILEKESKYIIIEGIGGIGKSMFLTHLFLSSVQNSEESEQIPLLLSLKDYKEDTNSIVDFIWKSVRDFDSSLTQIDIVEHLENKKLVLLMDGLDEIQTNSRNSFDEDLEAFIKSYPGNMIIITSRPIYSFISYSKFSIYDIMPLTKSQAISLIEKLEFWDNEAKENFVKALNKKLYNSHYEFASNPLLLTIMLMTYSSFGEVPAKMHVFYSKAYETMARLHDATKGSYKRALHTKLTPEDFSKYFAEFCARTYRDEELEFTEITFSAYMNKVLKNTHAERNNVSPHDFLLDLTDNLCIMYREGDKYYFIHRSFQEYFAAVHFASDYDAKLCRVGIFFDKIKRRSSTDRTFDMLYDMIPEKVERYIFLPYLETLINKCNEVGKDDEYWEFLENQYLVLYYQEGETEDTYFTEPQSFIYQAILDANLLNTFHDLDELPWPEQIYEMPTRDSVSAYEYFLDSDAYTEINDVESIDEKLLENTIIVFEDTLPHQYISLFGSPKSTGTTIEIEIYKLRKQASKYTELRDFMEQPDFPLFEEYHVIKDYYHKLQEMNDREEASEDLFDD